MKFMQIEPQPARGTLDDSMWDSEQWIAEEKYDGDRRIAQFCGKIVRFTGRRKSVADGLFVEKTANIPHLAGLACKAGPVNAMMSALIPPLNGTVLDGEIVFNPDNMPDFAVDGGRSKYVTSIMGSKPEEAVRKQIERGWLRYVVFDCLFYKGQDLRGTSLRVRGEHAVRAVKEWGNPYASAAPSKGGRFKREFLKEILSFGGEGVVLKKLDHKYGDKSGWVKVKAEWTADVVIMGYKAAKETSVKVDGALSMTKYAKAGLIGALVCGQYPAVGTRTPERLPLVEVATVSGMTDDQRRDFSEHGRKYIGDVIEIAHNGREPTGRFRHPRFKRFRSDKAAKDCVYREGEV